MRNYKGYILGFLCLCFVASCSVCSALELTEQEANQLQTEFTKQKNILTRLSINNEKQSKELNLLKAQLAESKESLMTTRISLQSARKALDDANESLRKQEAEEKRLRDKLKAQRNTWIAISCVVLIAYIKK